MDFAGRVELAARLMEAVGVLTIVVGAPAAGWVVLRRSRRGAEPALFRAYRQNLGRAILLGLEFLVAADIIRTVSEIPTLERVIVLAVIVLIRTFLSFTLEVELEGSWPWQRSRRRPRTHEGHDPRRVSPPP